TGYTSQVARFKVAKSKTGAGGSNGQRTIKLSLYKWGTSAPTTFPSGSSTVTWSTGAFTLPSTLNGWAVDPGLPSFGTTQTLYQGPLPTTHTRPTPPSTATWPASSAIGVGGAGSNGAAGSNGTNGQSARTAYIATASITPPASPTPGSGDVAPSGWSFTAST